MLKIYLDTSIPSAPFDATKPMRNHITTQWFENEAKNYIIFCSELTMKELSEWNNQDKRVGAIALLESCNANTLSITTEIDELANVYIKKGALPPTEKNDALHLACATLNEVHHFISWDFKHIVSVNPILKLQEIHQKLNLPFLKIGTLDAYGGSKYGIFEPEKFTSEKHKIQLY